MINRPTNSLLVFLCVWLEFKSTDLREKRGFIFDGKKPNCNTLPTNKQSVSCNLLSQRAKWDALANVLLSSYLKVLIQIASFFSVKYSSSKVTAKSISRNPKRPQKQSKQHRSSFLLDDVITLRALKKNGYIEIYMGHCWDCSTLWSTHDPCAAHRAKKKFKLARRALRPSLRENKRNDFNLLNILKVYWKLPHKSGTGVEYANFTNIAWVRRVPSATVSQAVTRQNFRLKAEMFSFYSKYFVYRELKWAPHVFFFFIDTGTGRILDNILYCFFFSRAVNLSLKYLRREIKKRNF